MSASATFKAALARARAIPRPTPRPAPVTSATLLGASWCLTVLASSHCPAPGGRASRVFPNGLKRGPIRCAAVVRGVALRRLWRAVQSRTSLCSRVSHDLAETERLMPVVLVGTLDTKGRELAFVRDVIRRQGLSTLVIDAGSVGPPEFGPDIDREQVFDRAGTSLAAIRERGDRGHAVAKAAEGVAALAVELSEQGRIEGIFSLGGSAGTTIGTAAMRSLRFGIPKIMVSTMASGQTRPYV